MRVALIGSGHWHAPMHADAIAACGHTVCAAWDPDGHAPGSPAAGLAARVALQPAPSLQAVFAAGPDLCLVMGHPGHVPGFALRVLDEGLPMVLEKPAAATTAILSDLAARAGDAFVAVPLPHRLGPAMLRAGSDPVAHASFRIVNGPPRRYRDDGVPWVLDPEVAGGGALRNLGIHGIDCALALARGRLRVVAAEIARRLHPEEAVEDHALVTLTDEAGAMFVVEAGYTTPNLGPGGDFEWRVATRDAYAVDRGDAATALTAEGGETLAPLPMGARYGAFWADTFDRLRDGRPPLVALSDYVAAMAVIDEAYARAAT